MPEPPIKTIGTVLERLNDRTFKVELKNSKTVIAHLPKAKAHLAPAIYLNSSLELDFTPYDMEKARIAKLISSAGNV